MPTSLPISATRSRSNRGGRRLLLGWSWSDWGLFIAAYGIILCAVFFVTPNSRSSAGLPQQTAADSR